MYRLKTSKLNHSPLGLGVPSSFKRVQIMVCSKTSAATGNCSKCSPIALWLQGWLSPLPGSSLPQQNTVLLETSPQIQSKDYLEGVR